MRCHKPLRDQCTKVSQEMLILLEDVLGGSSEQFGALVWQYLHYPFFVFMALFGEILVTGQTQLEQNRASLRAMERLPLFLHRLQKRTPLASKMKSIAARVIDQTKLLLDSHAASHRQSSAEHGAESSSDNTADTAATSPLMALLTPAAATNVSQGFDLEHLDMHTEGLYTWDDDFLFNGAVDWLKWDEGVFQAAC